MITFIVQNSQNDNCQIVDASQLSQTHFNFGCNKYNYTLWPFNRTIEDCNLFLGLDRIPEMLSLRNVQNVSYCRTVTRHVTVILCQLSITSCSLDDETIAHPVNSRIFASTVEDIHMYSASLSCPFEYCLPQYSHLNLSDPDSLFQCNRSVVLCGQCQCCVWYIDITM